MCNRHTHTHTPQIGIPLVNLAQLNAIKLLVMACKKISNFSSSLKNRLRKKNTFSIICFEC